MIKADAIYLRSPLYLQKFLFCLEAKRITGWKYRKDFYIKSDELEKTQFYSFSDLQALQLQRLKIMLRHCYDNVPYYRRLFEDIKLRPSDIRSLEDMRRIPVLTREQVKRNLFALTATNVPRNQKLLRNTSGTTGSPMCFFVDKKSYSINRAYTKRHWDWAGFSVPDKRITLQGRRIVNPKRTRVPFWMYNKADKQLLFSTYHLSTEYLPYFVRKVFEFAPRAIDAYPSAVYVLAKHMNDHGMKYKMQAVFTSSETLYPIQRELIEKVFQCRVFDKYGLSEMFFVAAECDAHQGLHVNMEYAITQVLDARDEPVLPGTEGRIICSGLENFSMPLIRYDTGDIGKFLPSNCSCGREFPLMAPVTTKAEDQILTPDGRYISGSLLTFPFKPMKNIIKSQIVQEADGRVRIKIVKNRCYGNKDSQILLQGLRGCLGRESGIILEFVDDIARTENGKYRWVISRFPKKMDFEKDNV